MTAKKTRSISEPTSKKARPQGRPRAMSPETEAMLRHFHPDVRTKRGIQDVYFRSQTMLALKDHPGFEWLMDWDALMRGDEDAWKPSILTELGRLANPETMRYVAGVLCERQPETPQALAFLRRLRGVAEKPGDAAELAKVIGAAIDRYRRSHPGTTFDQVAEALAMQNKFVATLQEQAEQAEQRELDDVS